MDIKKALWYIALLLRELGTNQDLKDALQIMINVQVESVEPQIPQSDR